MKRFVSVLLALVVLITGVLWPLGASAAVEGKTIDEFLGWITDNYPGYISSHTTEYKKRTLLATAINNADGSMSMILGYSYQNSDTLEFALVDAIDNYDLAVYFLASMSNAATPQARVDEATQNINSITGNVMQVFSDTWSKKTTIGNYYLEAKMAQDGSSGFTLMWLNEKSKQKNKTAAVKLFSGDKYPLSAVVADLVSAPKATATAKTNASAVTLSAGEWDCPAHIAAGEYVVTPIDQAGISVWRESDLVANEYLVAKDGDEIGRLVLKSGDSIKINGGKMEFLPFQK